MKNERINYGEFKIFTEISPLIKLRLKKIRNKFLNKEKRKQNKILVVDTCIIGDFLATLPALRTFINKNQSDVDLIVSPSVKPLAERIKGVNKIILSRSSYNRETEKKDEEITSINDYDLIVILRISSDAYKLIKNIKNAEIITCDAVYFKYLFHLLKNTLLKKYVKQSREVIFEIVGEKYDIKSINLDDIFKFNKSDYYFIKKIPEMKGDEKKILIHPGSGWKVKLWQNKKWVELLKK
jgi:ADP-heptose:LPS heptosyltransferase